MSRQEEKLLAEELFDGLYHVGPSKEKGALPAFFYFSLSGRESLELDPFNQPIQFLNRQKIRAFSLDLPGHGPGQDKMKAIQFLADELASGKDPLTPFIEKVKKALDRLVQEGWVDPSRVAIGGLSRGVFYSAHLMRAESRFSSLCGFAPMTNLCYQPAFASQKEKEEIRSLNLERFAKELVGRKVRCYIGNWDERVSTACCFEWILALTEANIAAKVRKPPVELMIEPAVGHMGHGTPPERFKKGSCWVESQLIKS